MSLDPAIADRIAAAGEAGFPDRVAHTQALVRFGSTRGAEHAIQDFVYRCFRERGFAMDRFAMDRFAMDRAAIAGHPGGAPMARDHSEAPIVVGRHHPRSETGRSLILQAHVDVVPPGAIDLWTHPPSIP